MGADLVGYMLWHENESVPEDRIESAKALAADLHKQAVETLKMFEGEDDLLQDYLSCMGEEDELKIPEPLRGVINYSEEIIGDEWVGTLLEQVLEHTRPEAVEEMLSAVLEGNARDISSRVIEIPIPFRGLGPKKITVYFAGAMSWGEEPDGLGYRSCRAMEWLGLTDVLGIF